MTLCQSHKPRTLSLSRGDKLRTTSQVEESEGQFQCPYHGKSSSLLFSSICIHVTLWKWNGLIIVVWTLLSYITNNTKQKQRKSCNFYGFSQTY